MRRLLPPMLAALPLFAACALSIPDDTEPEATAADPLIESVSQEIKSGFTSNDAPFTLAIEPFFADRNGFTTCTAIALTPHWLLTAGHCLNNQSDFIDRVSVYRQSGSGSQLILANAPVTGFRSSTYNVGDASTDVGLIRLFGEMNPQPTDFGRIYTDAKSPLNLGTTRVAGWGWGNTSSSESCSLSNRIPVTGLFTLISWAPTTAIVIQNAGDEICDGDSGGPWFYRVGTRRLAVALSSQATSHSQKTDCSGRCINVGDQVVGPRLSRWVNWIEQATAFGNLPVTCSTFSVTHDDGQSYSYRRCFE